MKFCVVNLGCKVNRVESDAASSVLSAAGHILCNEENADVILINTCTVTGEAEKKTRKAVRHALNANEYAQVIVTGCASEVAPSFFRSLSDRVEVVSKADLVPFVENLATAKNVSTCGVQSEDYRWFTSTKESLRVGDSFPTRVGIKVQDGCNNACTYCIVHVARGKAISRPCMSILKEAKLYAESQVKEIVLTGINLGSYYNESIFQTFTLAGLLKTLLVWTEPYQSATIPPCRFRISSIEPKDISEDLIEVLSQSNGTICRHLHLPLQSGSSKVLREMARPYTAEEYKNLVEKLYRRIPNLALSTDIIVGFPGETEKDFQETLELARACHFNKIHVFPYSMREGTPAAQRKDQVSPEVKSERAAQLRQLSEELHHQDALNRVGKQEMVLVEEVNDDGARGTTESYHEVFIRFKAGSFSDGAKPQDIFKRGSLVPVVLSERMFTGKPLD